MSVVFIGTDEEVWAKITNRDRQDFDLFAVNTAQLQRYVDAGLTTPLDLNEIPNQIANRRHQERADRAQEQRAELLRHHG
ncbi:MAG: hypothetical protein IPK59_19815 [Rhodospirillaceae bacterium]|nr:hypothetical protein [Rhodospirillaceae bacterium]